MPVDLLLPVTTSVTPLCQSQQQLLRNCWIAGSLLDLLSPSTLSLDFYNIWEYSAIMPPMKVSHGCSSFSHGCSSCSHGYSSFSHGCSSCSHSCSSCSHGCSSFSHGCSSCIISYILLAHQPGPSDDRQCTASADCVLLQKA